MTDPIRDALERAAQELERAGNELMMADCLNLGRRAKNEAHAARAALAAQPAGERAMSDPARAELAALVAAHDEHGGNWLPVHEEAWHNALKRARGFLTAPTPPAGGAARGDRLPPKVGHIFQLAAIICDAIAEADTKITDPTTLAQKILSDPRSQWAPAQEDKGNG